MWQLTTTTPEQTAALGSRLASLLEPGDVIVLVGDLGAGKTVFVQGLASGLNIKEPVRSPTFTLVHEYLGHLPLYHFDVYRLDGLEDLEDIGYEEYIHGSGVSVLEWGDKVEEYLPPDHLRIHIVKPENGLDNERNIFIELLGESVRKIEELKKLVGFGS